MEKYHKLIILFGILFLLNSVFGYAEDTFSGVTEDIPLGTPIASNQSITHDQEIEDDNIDTMFDGVITFQGSNYDTRDVLVFGQNDRFVKVMTSLTSTEDDYHTDVVLEADVDSIKYYYVFDEAIQLNATTSSDPLEIKFLGKTLRITNIDRTVNNKFTAQVGTEYFMDVGDSVEVEGKTVTLENVGEGGAVLVDVDGVKETIGSTTETVNGIEIKVDETFYSSTAKSGASLIMGKETVETYKDGDAYTGEDFDDPNWVWNIGNLNEEAATTTSVTTEYTGPYIGIENDFVWNDDSDNPAGVGECIDLPNNYLKICMDSLTVKDTDYKTYTFEKDSDTDLSEADGGTTTSAATLYIYTNQPEGLLIDTSELDTVGTITDPMSDKVWVWKCLDGTPGGNNNKAGIYYEDSDGKTKMAGCINNGWGSRNILDINYDGTSGDNMKVYLEGNNGSSFSLVLSPYDAVDLPYNDDQIKMSWTADNWAFKSLGTTASSEEAGELAWIGYGATEFGATPIPVLIGTKDEDHRTRYGIIIRDPKAHGSSDQVVLEIPNGQVQANVVIKAGAQETPPADKIKYDINLYEGWNLISIPVILPDKSIEAVMADVNQVSVIYGYNPLTTGEWEVWRKNSETANTLLTIEPGKAYWVKMDQPSILTVEGTIDIKNGDAPGVIPTFKVYEGWNLIGYYGTKDETVSTALQNIDGKYSAIWTLFKDNLQSLQGTLKGINFGNQLMRTHGYWIYLKEDGVIVPTS